MEFSGFFSMLTPIEKPTAIRLLEKKSFNKGGDTKQSEGESSMVNIQ